MDQVSFPGWQPEKSISVVTREQTTREAVTKRAGALIVRPFCLTFI
jgi:hypothetical protein